MASKPVVDWWKEERAARERGFDLVGGVDEAGRGPLAGPVVAACVILPPDADLPGVRDSKALSPAARDKMLDLVREHALAIGVGGAEPEEIDRLNILRATHLAMRRAIEAAAPRPSFVLVDGLPVPYLPVPHQAIVKGDAKSRSIAAASIVAKVTRDRELVELEARYPGYGFAQHKGYPSPEHLEALRRLGPCPAHRHSYAPVAEAAAALLTGPAQPELPFDAPVPAGISGERIAAKHLELHGWQILATRYGANGGEVDIVAREGETIVFAEVKTRRARRGASPAEAVDRSKRRRIALAAEAYAAEHGCGDAACRFDVVEVLVERSGLSTVRLVRDAFTADE